MIVRAATNYDYTQFNDSSFCKMAENSEVCLSEPIMSRQMAFNYYYF